MGKLREVLWAVIKWGAIVVLALLFYNLDILTDRPVLVVIGYISALIAAAVLRRRLNIFLERKHRIAPSR